MAGLIPREEFVGLVFTAAEPAEIEQALRREGVLVWASDGRVRLSVHLYNDETDVDRALEALGRLRGRRPAPPADRPEAARRSHHPSVLGVGGVGGAGGSA